MSDMEKTKHHPFSLTARMVLFYMLGCAVTITCAGLFFRKVMREHWENQTYELLINHVTTLRNNITQNADTPRHSTETLLTFYDQQPLHGINGRLVDGSGIVIFTTAAIATAAPDPLAFPAQIPKDQDLTIARGAKDSATGVPTFWVAAELVGLENNRETLYQGRYDCLSMHQWLEIYDRSLILAISLGGLLSAFMGWAIARNGLHPLYQITRSLKNITAHDFHERIATVGWPREVAALAAEFNLVLTRLQHSFRQLSQFTADAAHEFRTPLNNLMGATSLALSKERSPQQYQALLHSHLEQFTRLNRMVESLLFLARADNSSTGFTLQSVDVGACSQEVIDFFSAVADEREVHLSAEGEATVTADDSMLRIALSNLVSNGLRFTPRGGKLRIKVERSPKHEVMVSVIDSGPGIAPEHYAHIFDRYYRLEKSRSTEGAGLGLSIVQTIMRLHNGKAVVGRDAGGGAVFTLIFPPNPTKIGEYQM
jgi:two-component system, OmpR family, heavy metal sensor histidine kinase CusS